MAKRKRDIQLKFRVTPQEREMIETKMAQFGTTNMAAYLRKMAIDGYVVKLDLPELRELAKINLDSARDKLMDILCNYQGYQGCRLILVYDAYKVKDNPGSTMKYHNIEVVYTKEAETADQYIERTTHQLGAKPQKYRVTVATSDALEQMIIWGNGATRMSALGLKAAVETAGAEYFK